MLKKHSIIPTSLHDKGLGEIRDKRNIIKNNKSKTQQADSQHQTKWRETQSDPSKEQEKTFTLSISIQHST